MINNVHNKIIKDLKAPKNQRNNFGNYNYRNQEDILEAIKPLLPEGYILTLNDDIVLIGDRFYVKATATLKGKDGEVSATAFAREPVTRKGMDDAQVTGATSSYARKYALNGLFCIDDTKDPDTDEVKKLETKDQKAETKPEPKTEKPPKPQGAVMDGQEWDALRRELMDSITLGDLQATFKKVQSLAGSMSKAQLDALIKEKDKTKTAILTETGGLQ
jgi:hypothetical protein